MIEHRQVSASFDEDWTVHCACGAAFYGAVRPDVEAACRKHVAEEGIAEARAALEGGEQ